LSSLGVAVQVFLFVLNDLFSNLSQVANNIIFFHLLTDQVWSVFEVLSYKVAPLLPALWFDLS